MRYLKSRGLTDPKMIEHFKLGFANRTLGYRLPDKNRNAGFPCVFVLCAVVFNSNASNMLSFLRFTV